MEEKLKAPDGKSGDYEVRLFQQCQELQAQVQEKEKVIAQLEQQLEEQVKVIHTIKEVCEYTETKTLKQQHLSHDLGLSVFAS